MIFATAAASATADAAITMMNDAWRWPQADSRHATLAIITIHYTLPFFRCWLSASLHSFSPYDYAVIDIDKGYCRFDGH